MSFFDKNGKPFDGGGWFDREIEQAAPAGATTFFGAVYRDAFPPRTTSRHAAYQAALFAPSLVIPQPAAPALNAPFYPSWLPRRSTTRSAAYHQAYFGRPFPLGTPAPAPAIAAELAVFPAAIRRAENRACRSVSFWRPSVIVPPPAAPAITAELPAFPALVRGRPKTSHRAPSFFYRNATPPPTPGRGPTQSVILLIDAEGGSSVTYSWSTDVLPAYRGLETRLALVRCPRESYAFTALLSDGQMQAIQSSLVARAAQGAVFGVGLLHESLLITATAASINVAVPTTAYSDWVEQGQTVAVVSSDGLTTATGVIQSYDATNIVLDIAVGAAGTVGGRIMPTVPCYLEETQTFGLYAVNAGTYNLKGRAVYFGNAGGVWNPRGASVTAYTDPISGEVFPVWDRGSDIDGTTPRASLAGTVITDRGGVLLLTARQSVSDFANEIYHRFSTDPERQYVKAFHGAVRGRQKRFLMPTWRADLNPLSDASTSLLIVQGPPLPNVNDYADQWFQSDAHRHLQLLKADGTVAYRTVTDASNVGDGTTEIQLDSALAGALARVSFLETCRLDSDDIVISYDANCVATWRCPVKAVQR